MNKPYHKPHLNPNNINDCIYIIIRNTCPNEPVATSTNASLGVGCPSRSDVCFLIFKSSSFEIYPA